jgi:signal transduction histidine kinase
VTANFGVSPVVAAGRGWEHARVTPLRRRLVLATVAFLAFSWGGQLILATTPFELHRTVTIESRAWNAVSELLWLVAMLTLMVRQPTSRLWLIILFWTAVAQVWKIGYLGIDQRLIVDLPQALLGELWAAAFVHIVVSYPSGRVTSPVERGVVVSSYAVALGFRTLGLLITPDDCTPLCNNPFRVDALQSLWDPLRYSALALALGLLLVALVVLVRHWRSASPASRRVLTPMVVAAPIWCASTFAGYFADAFLDAAARDATHSLNVLTILQSAIIPVAIIAGALQARLARGNVATLAVELGRGVPVGGLRPILARTLRDPSLQLAFPSPTGSGMVDELGSPVDAPDPDRWAVTRVERDGELLALLIDDPQAVAEDPSLVEAVGSVARLALANERLAAQVRAQLAEVRASRARIVDAADAERRRVERDLHDGAQQRLTALAVRLDIARETGAVDSQVLADATAELRSAIGEVRDLSRGIHPTILTEAGLGPAIEALAERTEIPVRVVAPATRFPAAIEAAAYFVVAEGLTNVTRYAAAGSAEVEVAAGRDRLVVTVRDDGRGGADPELGSGIRGLTDRVAALDGRLEVDSPPGGGTVLRVELPLAPGTVGPETTPRAVAPDGPLADLANPA